MEIYVLEVCLSLDEIRGVFYPKSWSIKCFFFLLFSLNMISVGVFYLLIKEERTKRTLQKRKTNQQREMLVQMQIATQEVERRRIGRELHDCISNKLSLILLKLNDEYSTAQLEADMIQTLLAVRNITHDLNPPFQSDSPLHLMIFHQIEKLKPNYTIHKTLRIYCRKNTSIGFKIQIIRIVQEVITNIIKHAEATAVSVAIRISSKGIYLSIEDNGLGPLSRREGQGYYNIKNRLYLLKGVFKVKGNRPYGTKIILFIPHEIQDNSS
ncbi:MULTISPECIES: sensor histidine kinase [unclassified Myroides]|uniref:sensor histidine kinase n=1 Tax=unclassified Myroides TaxID=2642485 RepID=UPI003D2F6ACE